jgi:hypothetical protein
VRIEDNVWLGVNVTVLKGVTIGPTPVIGAGSIVTGDIPANVIAAETLPPNQGLVSVGAEKQRHVSVVVSRRRFAVFSPRCPPCAGPSRECCEVDHHHAGQVCDSPDEAASGGQRLVRLMGCPLDTATLAVSALGAS